MSRTREDVQGLEAGPSEFSVIPGGPLFDLYRGTHLAGPALEWAGRRIAVLSLFAWTPLLVLSVLSHRALGGVNEPFFKDLDVHVRLLVALPLLLAGESPVHRRMRFVYWSFLDRGLVPAAAQPGFQAAAHSALRLRNSRWLEFALLLFVYVVGVGWIWNRQTALGGATWYRALTDTGPRLTVAGWWYVLVSLPLFQFILFRWYLRLALWARFLWKVARCGLQLIPIHPDRCAGVGFLDEVVTATLPLAAAHGALFTGVAGAGLLFDGRSLAEYGPELAVLVVAVAAVTLGPLLVFTPVLFVAKHRALAEYGQLAQQYVRAFDHKWIRGSGEREALLGTADIQSLADLGNSYQIVREMRLVPADRQTLLRLLVALAVPLVPLLFAIVPPSELMTFLLKGLA
ncbi:MAG TPA: hypothetical protein VGM84_13730 [Steroidobacteraceae bacterium]|jgi:hypothetical protein